jgi:hypothetical protein
MHSHGGFADPPGRCAAAKIRPVRNPNRRNDRGLIDAAVDNTSKAATSHRTTTTTAATKAPHNHDQHGNQEHRGNQAPHNHDQHGNQGAVGGGNGPSVPSLPGRHPPTSVYRPGNVPDPTGVEARNGIRCFRPQPGLRASVRIQAIGTVNSTASLSRR